MESICACPGSQLFDDAKPALRSNLHGIYHVGAIFERPAEHARKPGVAQNLRVVFRQPSIVEKSNCMRIAGRDMAEEQSQSFGQCHVRAQRMVLFRGHGRHIHRIQRHAALQILHHLLDNPDADNFLRFFGRPGNMRSSDNRIQAKQFALARRLFFEYIEPRAANLAALHRRLQVLLRRSSSPRAQLTIRTPVFICANACAFSIRSVSGVSATCKVMKSLCR